MTTTISISTATYGSLLTGIVHADHPRIRDITELFPFQLQQVTFLGGLQTFSGDGGRLFLFFLSVHISWSRNCDTGSGTLGDCMNGRQCTWKIRTEYKSEILSRTCCLLASKIVCFFPQEKGELCLPAVSLSDCMRYPPPSATMAD